MIMSEPLELQAQRPYALDQLTMLQSQIMQTIQGMVVLRARIEKQRRSNIEAARDTYTELDRARGRLIEQLSKSELFLLEMEEYPLAAAADQLRRGLAGFNLMSIRRCFFIPSPMSMRTTVCVRETMCCPVIKSFRR